VRRRLVCALAIGGGLLAAVPAAAQDVNFFAVLFGPVGARDVNTWDLPVRWEGSVVVRFESAFGSGQVVWTPGPQGQFTVAEYRTRKGRHVMSAFLAPTGSPGASARVQSPSGVCTDTTSEFLDQAAVSEGKDGVRIALAGRTPASGGFHMTETRCGGPLFDDIGRALGSVRVGRRQLVKGGFDIDLRGSAPLAVAGMRASVDSTVVAHVGARTPAPPQPPDHAQTAATRQLTVSYRIERVAGGLTAALTGGGELCSELDSCGRSETLDLRTGSPGKARLDLTAYTSKRRKLADLRAALGLPGARGHAKGVAWSGYGSWGSGATTLGAVLSDPTAELCRDNRHVGGLILQIHPSGARIRADLSTDPTAAVRTSCPGPALSPGTELGVLASGFLPRSALRRKRLTVRLTRGRALATDGWSGQTNPDMTIVISRASVKVESLS
jgi:hypothetical protein